MIRGQYSPGGDNSYLCDNGLPVVVLIKIDVEGHELEVLKGAVRTLTTDRPVVLCESEDRHLAPHGKRVGDVLRFVAGLGYEVYAVQPGGSTLTRVGDTAVKSATGSDDYIYNYWFLPNKELGALIEGILSSDEQGRNVP